MRTYSARDVEKILRISRGAIRSLVTRRFVSPERGPGRHLRFSFQDLILMRTARGLLEARVPRRRINRALTDLQQTLPATMPLSGLSIVAVGERIVVRQGASHWQVDDGQYLLGLDVRAEGDTLKISELARASTDADADSDVHAAASDWVDQAIALEDTDPGAAIRAYEQATQRNPADVVAWTNWGRLAHEFTAPSDAEGIYRRALQQCGSDATLLFNLAVVLEDLAREDEAVLTYLSAVAQDPQLADAHYNLARLYEARGSLQHAIRHLGQYKRLMERQ